MLGQIKSNYRFDTQVSLEYTNERTSVFVSIY